MNAVALKDERKITEVWNIRKRIDGEDEVLTGL